MKLPRLARVAAAFAWAAALLSVTPRLTAEDTGRPAGTGVADGEVKVSGDARLDQAGKDSVVILLNKASGRASVEFNYPGKHLDLSAFRDLALRVDNHSAAELDVTVTGLSNFQVAYQACAQGRFLVRPGEPTDLRVLMTRPSLPKTHPLVQRLGNLYGFPWGHQRHWQYMQTDAILRVTARVDWNDAQPGQSVTISRPVGLGQYTVDPAVLDKLELPLVDSLGQTRGQDWPGKISDPTELRADAARDLDLVARVTRPGESRDRFGGFTNGPALKATGFFRVEKVEGKWWFVDPEGRLFWSLGVNTVGEPAETYAKGREYLFPESKRGANEILYYQDNLKLKHGAQDWRAKHVDVTLARMMDWGLNTIGAWSMPELATARRVPYTLMLHIDNQGFGGIRKIPDPYSRSFKKSLDERLSHEVAAHADSPWLLGIFIDNELEWRNGVELVEEILKSPARTPGRLALIEFLKRRHGDDVAAVNKAWGTNHASWDALRARTGPDAPPACGRDLRDFLAQFSDAYFSACRDAVRRYFPNHLYLGCRFHTLNPVVTASASRYCDVISANVYRYAVTDFSIPGAEDRPIIISEFHFGVRDYGLWGLGLVGAADARNQSDLVHAYLSDALRHPNIVGAHWFMWSNQIVTGREDGENFGVGLVTVVDRPITPLVDAFRDVSHALYDYRLSPSPSRIGAPAGR